MIDFRYHIVSIVAIFLALATGVALGAGPLKGPVDNGLAAQAQRDRQDKADLRGQLALLEETNDFESAFAAEIAPNLVADRLAGRGIVLIALPDADDGVATDVRAMLVEAGASVSPLVRLGEDLLDPTKRQMVDQLSSQVLPALPELRIAPDAATYDRAGAILARGLVATADAGAPLDESAREVLSVFRAAKLAVPDADLTRRDSLALILTGPRAGTDATTVAQDTIVVALAAALDGRCDGVVVAGPPPAAQEGGMVAAVRDDAATAAVVSTVDVIATPSGQISAVYALAQQAQGDSGQYGAIGNTDGALARLDGRSGP